MLLLFLFEKRDVLEIHTTLCTMAVPDMPHQLTHSEQGACVTALHYTKIVVTPISSLCQYIYSYLFIYLLINVNVRMHTYNGTA